MDIIKDFIHGLLQVIKVTAAPMLYRYNYRISAEGLKADWQNIGKDIESVIGKLEEATHNGK